VNGIRFLSTLWVILAHRGLFMVREPWINNDYMFEVRLSIHHVINLVINNFIYLFIDSQT
jgi:hypothetical protein